MPGARAGLPLRAALHETGLYLALRDVPPEELKDAFVFETMNRLPMPDRFVQVDRADLGKAAPETAPTGIVFHVARSGSTLVSQLLKKRAGVVVHGEPQAVNEILMPPHKWPRADMVGALRSLGAGYAAHAGAPYVLKLSSWTTLFADIVREAFPQTPWVFLYRDPLEVGVSLTRSGPGWFRNEQDASVQIAKLIDPQGASASRDEYIARVFGALCQGIGRLDPQRGRVVAYDALPSAVWNVVAPHFGFAISAGEQAEMEAAARTYSKAKAGDAAEFAADAETKRSEASPELRKAISTFAQPELDRLLARAGA